MPYKEGVRYYLYYYDYYYYYYSCLVIVSTRGHEAQGTKRGGQTPPADHHLRGRGHHPRRSLTPRGGSTPSSSSPPPRGGLPPLALMCITLRPTPFSSKGHSRMQDASAAILISVVIDAGYSYQRPLRIEVARSGGVITPTGACRRGEGLPPPQHTAAAAGEGPPIPS